KAFASSSEPDRRTWRAIRRTCRIIRGAETAANSRFSRSSTMRSIIARARGDRERLNCGAPMSAEPILVVEDDETIRDMMRFALEDGGYEVDLAADGAEALAAIEARPPRLILLDVRMPGMNGHEFAAAYHALPGPRVPVIVVTAARDAADRALAIGAD